jgi:flagellar motor protein MotB
MMKRFALVGMLALLAAGCAGPPRPATLSAADHVARSAAVKDASAVAPQVVAHADSLRRQADAAYERGEIAAADILAERAVVAYERAAVLARLARAELLAAEAEKNLAESATQQRELNAERERLDADIASIEQLILVVRDAQPITPTPPSDPSRELARLTAARSIVVDARLLCTAARLLGRPIEGLENAQSEVARLEEALAKWPRPTPLDETLRARTACLSLLTLARSSGPSAPPADLVLAELSQVPDLHPHRDDRGVVVVVIQGNLQREEQTKARLEAIARVAKKYPAFPVLVVGHTRAKAPPAAQTAIRDRARAIASALEAEGVEKSRMEQLDAGPHRPIVHDPLPPPTNSRNDRVEVILVAPAS